MMDTDITSAEGIITISHFHTVLLYILLSQVALKTPLVSPLRQVVICNTYIFK